MRKIPVYALKSGMTTGKNIYNPNGNLLLKADTRLTEAMLSDNSLVWSLTPGLA